MTDSLQSWWLRLLAVLIVVIQARGLIAGEPRRPNVVLILSDDQRWDTIGALGNPEIRTPNLDQLVSRGYHFKNAYCMGSMVPAVCLPSRTMLITGRSLWRIPEKPNAKNAPAGVSLLPSVLKSVGYRSFHSGKAGNACRYGNAAFDINLETEGRTEASATEHADRAIAFLGDQDSETPFFLYLAPPVPHDPRLAPREFGRLYESEKLTLSKNFMPRHPFDNGELAVRDELLAPLPRTAPEMREQLADYYASVSHLDHEVGRVLAELKDRGLEDQTIVIYTSDQGLAVGGRHGLMGKQNLYEHVKPPLVIAGPGIPQGESNALVYLFDLFPTICDLAGAKVPEEVEGRSLLPVVLGRKAGVREWLLGAYRECQRMVRDERWKLIVYRVGGVTTTQLFDLESDPEEIVNLADDLRFAGKRVELESALKRARAEYGDPVDF